MPLSDKALLRLRAHTHKADVSRRLVRGLIEELIQRRALTSRGVPMLLWCPECGARHIDEGEYATKPHHTHSCQNCGMVWRPAIDPTVGVQFLPGFKNAQ